MLDTHARQWVQPVITKTAQGALKLGLTPNQVTIMSFVIGILTGPFIYFDLPYVAVILLWLSGFLDWLFAFQMSCGPCCCSVSPSSLQ